MANPQAFSGRNGYSLYFNVTQHLEPGNNRSRFDWSLYIYATNVSFKPYSLDPTSTITASIGGTAVVSGNFSYDYRSAVVNTVVTNFGSGSHYISHDTSGYLGPVSWTSTAVATGPLGSATADGSSGAQDFDRSPSWIDSSVNGTATRGTAYSDGVSANAAGSYSIVSGGLPPGIGLNSSNGVVSGTPTAVGTYNFTIRANGAFEGAVDTALSINVRPALPVFSDSSVATATRATAYSDGVAASEAASYSLRNSDNTGTGALPAGLSLNTSTGAITGTPTATGSTQFRVRATNVTGSTDTGIITLTVNPALPVFSDSAVAATAIVGTAYSDSIAASEAASYSVFSGALPGGISLNTTTGAITGTPTVAGVFTFVLRATNVTGSTNTPSRTITVTSGARLWNGTTFISGNTKAWNGTTFVSTTTRVWNGSGWVSAT
jgi:hypothetical protein